MRISQRLHGMTRTTLAALAVAVALSAAMQTQGAEAKRFEIVEATIGDVQSAIRNGATTCEGVVRVSVDRAKAYNGVSDRLVTADGAPVAPAPGVTRAGA